jgi:hypothetical protein
VPVIDPTYTLRLSLASEEATYRLSEDALHCTTAKGTRTLPFAEIGMVRVYESPGQTSLFGQIAPAFARCVIRPRRGRAIVLSSKHFIGFGRFDDRSATFRPFVDTLLARLGSAHPGARLLAGMPPALWWTWVALLAAVALVTPVFIVVIVQELIAGRVLQMPAVLSSLIVFGAALGIVSYARVLRRNRPRRFTPSPS